MVLFFAQELFTSFYVPEIESRLIKQTTTLRCSRAAKDST